MGHSIVGQNQTWILFQKTDLHQTHYRLIRKTDENADIYTDITFGHKPEILSLFCAFRFVEDFWDAVVQYIVYGKVDFNEETGKPENPMLYPVLDSEILKACQEDQKNLNNTRFIKNTTQKQKTQV